MKSTGAEFTLGPVSVREGRPDGSAGVAIDESHFVGACDEDNVLRLYSVHAPRGLRDLLDLNPVLGFPKKKDKFRECDLEGAARIGDLIFWIGSHGRNNEGERRENRRVLLATLLSGKGGACSLALAGKPCQDLLDALLADPRLQRFHLAEAEAKHPQAEGGLNIESLCADGDRLLIGFRNPVPGEGALLVPLMNPSSVIEGAKPRLGDPICLDLGGRGIRDMARWRERFLVIGGDYRDRHAPGALVPGLFLWSGRPGETPARLHGDLGDLNPEAVLVFGGEAASQVRLLSDDGGQSFRTVRVSITGAM